MHTESAQRVVGLVLRTGSAPPLTDAQLLQEFARDRAPEAFAEIVRRHGSMVFGVCRRLLNHQQDAEDAFQATFLVLARKAPAVPLESLGGWLYGVACRTARRAKSRRHRDSERQTALASQIPAGEAMPSEPSDWLSLLDEELNRLSDRERLPIILFAFIGRSRKEAAKELGLSEGTLSSRLARGRERLRSRLTRRGVVPAISAAGLVLESRFAPAALIDSTFFLATTVSMSAVIKLAEGVSQAMRIHATARTLAISTGIMLLGGIGLWWGLSPVKKPPEQKQEIPVVAVAPAKNEMVAVPPAKNDTTRNDEKREAKVTEAKKEEKDAAQVANEKEKKELERLSGTWKVVYSNGEPPAVKLPNGGVLPKPRFLVIDKDHLTWDAGTGGATRFSLRLPDHFADERAIDICLNSSFPDSEIVYGAYSLGGEYLQLSWSVRYRAYHFLPKTNWPKQIDFGFPPEINLSEILDSDRFLVIVQRVAPRDPKAAPMKSDDEKQDRASLNGRWRITGVAGRQNSDAKIGYEFMFQGDAIKILRRDADDSTRSSWSPIVVNAHANPKQIVFFGRDSFGANNGIYQVEKNRLEICWRGGDPNEKVAAPTRFEVEKDSKTIQLIHLQRVDAELEKSDDGKAQLVELKKALVEALQNHNLGLWARIQAGKDPISVLLDASQKLMDAQLALAADKKARISVREAHLQRLILYESLCKEEMNAGKRAEYEYAQVRAGRLMAEILWQKEKAE